MRLQSIHGASAHRDKTTCGWSAREWFLKLLKHQCFFSWSVPSVDIAMCKRSFGMQFQCSLECLYDSYATSDSTIVRDSNFSMRRSFCSTPTYPAWSGYESCFSKTFSRVYSSGRPKIDCTSSVSAPPFKRLSNFLSMSLSDSGSTPRGV